MELFQDQNFRLWYIAGGVLLMVGPMVALSLWYHRNILSSEGGRRLMQRHNKNRPRPHFMPNLRETAGMARGISSGKYGQYAKRMQNRVYWVCAIWVVAVAVYFGVLLWADETARVTGAVP